MIETDRLQLRPMRIEDVEPLLAVFGDLAVMAAFGVPPFDREAMEQWVQRNLNHQAAHGYGLYAVILKANGLVIGDCGLERLEDEDVPTAELGYDLRRDHWGQGLATQAAAAVRDYAFGQLALPRLVSLIRQGNAASRRVAEKIGMRHEADIVRWGQPYWRFAIKHPDIDPDSAAEPEPRD